MPHLWKIVENSGQSHYQHPHSSNHHTKENPFNTHPNFGLPLIILGCSSIRTCYGKRATRRVQFRSILFGFNAVIIRYPGPASRYFSIDCHVFHFASRGGHSLLNLRWQTGARVLLATTTTDLPKQCCTVPQRRVLHNKTCRGFRLLLSTFRHVTELLYMFIVTFIV